MSDLCVTLGSVFFIHEGVVFQTHIKRFIKRKMTMLSHDIKFPRTPVIIYGLRKGFVYTTFPVLVEMIIFLNFSCCKFFKYISIPIIFLKLWTALQLLYL